MNLTAPLFVANRQLYRLAVRRDEETESILSEEASAVEDIDLV